MRTIFSLIFFGYGFGILFRNNKEIKGLSSFSFYYDFYKFYDWEIVIRPFYKYNFIFRIYLNREK